MTGYLPAPGAARPARAAHRHARRVPADPPRPGRPGADHAGRARAARGGASACATSSGSTARSLEQFGSFLAGLPRGDLGTSINLQQPVRDIVGPADLAEHLPARLRHAHLAARRRAARRPLGALPQPARRPRDPRRRDGRPRDAVVLVRAAARRGRSACTSSWLPVSGYGTGFFGHLREPDAARDHASASTWRR